MLLACSVLIISSRLDPGDDPRADRPGGGLLPHRGEPGDVVPAVRAQALLVHHARHPLTAESARRLRPAGPGARGALRFWCASVMSGLTFYLDDLDRPACAARAAASTCSSTSTGCR